MSAPTKFLYKPLYRPAVFSGFPRVWEYVEALPRSRAPAGGICRARVGYTASSPTTGR